MTDRIIRDELLESDRWIDLPSDTDRLVFVALLMRADDFGNFEATLRPLFRYLREFTTLKTEETTAATLLHLIEADLLRSYAVNGRNFYHVPRFRSQRWYYARKCPASPWDEQKPEGKKTRRELNQSLAENVVTTSLQRSTNVAEGVGVGVGVLPLGIVEFPSSVGDGTEEPRALAHAPGGPEQAITPKPKTDLRGTRLKPDAPLPDHWRDWAIACYPTLTPAAVVTLWVEFRNYWSDVPGAKGLKLRWFQTFQNRVHAKMKG